MDWFLIRNRFLWWNRFLLISIPFGKGIYSITRYQNRPRNWNCDSFGIGIGTALDLTVLWKTLWQLRVDHRALRSKISLIVTILFGSNILTITEIPWCITKFGMRFRGISLLSCAFPHFSVRPLRVHRARLPVHRVRHHQGGHHRPHRRQRPHLLQLRRAQRRPRTHARLLDGRHSDLTSLLQDGSVMILRFEFCPNAENYLRFEDILRMIFHLQDGPMGCTLYFVDIKLRVAF